MPTASHLAFDHTPVLIGNGQINFSTHTFKVMALNGTPNGSDTVPGNLTAASNLVAATITLSGDSWATADTDDAKYDAGDITFTASGGSSVITHFAMFDEDATSPVNALVSYGDADTAAGNITLASGEKLKLQWDATGVLRINDTA